MKITIYGWRTIRSSCMPPPDLNCPDIPSRNFTVRPPDPQGFDGNDNDGVGCDS
jgi:hypothetical protein